MLQGQPRALTHSVVMRLDFFIRDHLINQSLSNWTLLILYRSNHESPEAGAAFIF